jgi:hypothetical protein
LRTLGRWTRSHIIRFSTLVKDLTKQFKLRWDEGTDLREDLKAHSFKSQVAAVPFWDKQKASQYCGFSEHSQEIAPKTHGPRLKLTMQPNAKMHPAHLYRPG